MTFIEELEALDRPYKPFEVSISNGKLSGFARNPSYEEQDAINAFQMDEYVRLLSSYTVAKKGSISEEQKRRNIFSTRTKKELIDEIIPTIKNDIERRAYELLGLDIKEEGRKILALETDEEREAYVKEQEQKLMQCGKDAEAEYREELKGCEHKELVERLVQVNMNVNALQGSARAADAHFLFYSVYTVNADGQFVPAFASAAQVNKFSPKALADISHAVREALRTALPFASQDVPAQDAPGSSASDSEVETPTASGSSTEDSPSD